MIIRDTHALIWTVDNDPHPGNGGRALVAASMDAGRVKISPINTLGNSTAC